MIGKFTLHTVSCFINDEEIEDLYIQEGFDNINKHVSPVDHYGDEELESHTQSIAFSLLANHAPCPGNSLPELLFADLETFASNHNKLFCDTVIAPRTVGNIVSFASGERPPRRQRAGRVKTLTTAPNYLIF